MTERDKGFTLIELLISIAIIGIIFSIVIVYMSDARGRGNDTKVKAQLSRTRSTVELYFSNNNNSYNGSAGNISGPCNTPNSMFTDTASGMATYATQANYPTGATLTCYSIASAYAMSALLPGAGGTNSWCVDSLGNSKARSMPITSTVC
ncbi:MAG: prepilin-type N-terminal cleavage/methylation domain-containing protein [Candidatus Zambryskibacteria bacterium]|nr:prepilin-type N-terminal cleavage/methylation domain-containing protein [Candidatus Zambryskibacteria bacterium]